MYNLTSLPKFNPRHEAATCIADAFSLQARSGCDRGILTYRVYGSVSWRTA